MYLIFFAILTLISPIYGHFTEREGEQPAFLGGQMSDEMEIKINLRGEDCICFARNKGIPMDMASEQSSMNEPSGPGGPGGHTSFLGGDSHEDFEQFEPESEMSQFTPNFQRPMTSRSPPPPFRGNVEASLSGGHMTSTPYYGVPVFGQDSEGEEEVEGAERQMPFRNRPFLFI